MKLIFVLFLSFFTFYSANESKSAEKINIKFEEMSIPLTIDQLTKLSDPESDSTEVIDWFKQKGFTKVFELSKFLNLPVFKEESLNRKVLRSWLGRRILTELSNTILIQNYNDGVEVFNTIIKDGKIKFKIDCYDNFISSKSPSDLFKQNKYIKFFKGDIAKLQIKKKYDKIIFLAGIASPFIYKKYPCKPMLKLDF